MAELFLLVLGTVAAGAIVTFISARPVMAAAAQGHQPPAHASGARIMVVAMMLGLSIAGSLWLGLDGASPGGLIGQLDVAAQLVPIMLAVGLGACLSALTWRPDWVMGELRRLAVALPVSVLLVLLITGLVGDATLGLLIPALLGAAALFAMSRLLAAPSVLPRT